MASKAETALGAGVAGENEEGARFWKQLGIAEGAAPALVDLPKLD